MRRSWTDAASDFLMLAEEAKLAGDDVVYIVAMQRAADCLHIARNLQRGAPAQSSADEGERNG